MGQLVATAALVAIAYYVGANFGFMLRLPPATPSVLWPPNTILTAALLMSPPRRWPLYLLAALPAHLAAELQLAWPLSLVLALFASNCSQALIAAAGARWFSDAPARFDTLRRVTVFILSAGLAAPFLSSFPDAAAIATFRGEAYWLSWRTRFFSNVLSELVLGPAIVLALTAAPTWIRTARRARKVEAASLVLGLAVVGVWAFGVVGKGPGVIQGVSVVVFLLPLIVLAAVRFGPGGASLALLTTLILSIWASAHRRGPFASLPLPDLQTVFEVQVLLSAVAIPILCLSAVIVERRQAMRSLVDRLRLEVVLSQLSAAFVHLPSDEMDPVLETSVRQVGEVARVDRVVLRWQLADGRQARYAWSVPGAERDLAVLPREQFPWTLEQLRGDGVVFSRLEDLPVAAAQDVESFRRHDIQSAAIVPLLGRGRVRGALSALTVTRERTWDEGLVQWLGLAAAIFANALARKEAEDALRASEASKSAILGSLISSVAVLDRDGRIIDVNARWARATPEPGPFTSASLVLGANVLHAWGEAADAETPYAAEAVAGVREVLRGDRPGFTYEYSTNGGAGQQWFVMSVVPLERVAGGAVLSCTEITERKHAELDAQRSRQELAHFSRVSTMGQLTASIAHELNQPLTGILTNARAGLRFLDIVPPDLGELRGILSDIVDDDKRASEVIQRLRSILRKGEPEWVLLDLNVLVQDVVRLLSSDAIIRRVTVTLEPDPEPAHVYGGRVELQQVVLNLLLNALEATADAAGVDGTVVVAIEKTHDKTVHVTVRDSGAGIKHAREVLFEPFFTTKPAGMGMGLTISRSIIEAHGGVIWATDNPDGGAIFHFAVPAASMDSQ